MSARLAALRESAFELHAQLAALLRESEDEHLTAAADGVQAVANELGRVEAVMAPHRALLARSAVRH